MSLVLDLRAGGMRPEEIVEEYDLVEEDILACIIQRGRIRTCQQEEPDESL